MNEYACALIIDHGRLLLGRRAPYRKSYASKWDLIGGRIETGKTQLEALTRELQEEIAITPQTPAYFDSLPDPHVAPQEPPLYHFFRVETWSGTPYINNHEHTELAWVPLSRAGTWPDLALQEYSDLFRRLAAFYSVP